ncbi:MAG TPA: ABC transporter substrate-binding protein [Armatimonadaceae bacterium]|nr:ABC transporter substrate-binding protein [Armatimonadaceae bacterium]
MTTVAVALGLAGTGCSNNPYPPGESAGNVLYRTLSDDPKSLDPSFSYTVDEAYIVDLIYPSFYKYHYLKRDPFELELNIGAKEPLREKLPVTVTGPDGKKRTVQGERYTFTLKPGLRFQDDPCFPGGKGREIVARDVVYAFKRMADPKVQCPVAPFFADKIVGWEEYGKGFDAEDEAKRKAQYDREMEGVRVDPSDPLTFTVTLSQPYPQLKYLMAMHFTSPQAREAVEHYGAEYPRNPVGSGPYTLTEFKSKQRLVLTKNPGRHKDVYPSEGTPADVEAGLLADAGKELPLNDKVVFSVVKESTSSWNLFLQGYLDAAGVGAVNYQQVVTPSGSLSPELIQKGVSLRKETQMNVYYCAFNMNDPVWGGLGEKQKKMRQAVSLAINAQEYIDILLQGNGLPAQWVLPPSVFGHDDGFKNPYRQYDPDLTQAKKLLAEAGYPGGVDSKTGNRLTLYYDNTATTPLSRMQVGIVQKMIERTGIKVESRSSRPNVFQDKLLKGQHQFIFYGWFADYPDPENFVFLLYGPNKRPGPNSANYANPEYDRLFEQMRSMDDGPERKAIIEKMRAIAVEDCPWIPVFHSVSLSLSYDWQKNVKAHPIANDYNQYRAIDFEDRARKQRAWNQPNYLPIVVLALIIGVGAIPAIRVVRQRVNRRVRKDVTDAGEESA